MKKILMLHGWNYLNYTKMTDKTDAWHNREKLIKELKKDYELIKVNFPGFCGEKEPKKAWNLDDYANYVDELVKKYHVDIILGYSFGGAVAVHYAYKYNNQIDLILVSPAIVRKMKKSKKFVKTPKVFNFIRKKLRNLYTIYVTKTNEMKYGTNFLRNTYQNIVRVDLTDELLELNKERVLVIYGEKDEQVKVINNQKLDVNVIKNGGHDIGNTNTLEIVRIIKSHHLK